MLNPRFKSLKVVENYMGCGVCICFIAEYDANAIIPLLMTMFEVLNPTIQACAVEVVGFGDFIEEYNNIFGVDTSMDESSCACVVGELSLFKRLSVTLSHVLIL